MTSIVDDQIVNVAIEDGFEIPYAVGDLLKASSGEDDHSLAGRRTSSSSAGITGQERLFSIPQKAGQRPEGVYLAMVPTDQEKLLESRLEFYLVNHCPYTLSFGVFLNQSGKYSGLVSGQVDPDSCLLLKREERQQIEDWANGLVQFMFYQDGKTQPLNPASATIAFKPVKIYREDSFPFEGLLRKKAFFIQLATISEQDLRQEDKQTAQKLLQEKHLEGTRNPERKPAVEGFLDKHKVDDQIAEVDLHIGELTERITGLSNADMLRIQMSYFRRCMDEAATGRLKKIIFIHGIGNGTLKTELLRSLRQTEGIAFHDAPYARYGMGATEVVFYRHG